MNFENEMREKTALIENALRAYLEAGENGELVALIKDAMAYSVFAGGKRMRPLLTLGMCEMLGGSVEDALPFACAVEFIHTYSLIHDDLPAMDDDDMRRGKPTNHKVFGEATAILAGDGLLNMAYELMSARCTEQPGRRTSAAMHEVARAAGIFGMVGGQVADMYFENRNVTNRALLYIHERKTAALIKAALVSGAIIAGADEQTAAAVADAGVKLGVAFQIKDDILDVTADEQTLGKPTGSDLKNQKATYVSLHGLEKAHGDYAALSTEAGEILLRLAGGAGRAGEPFVLSYIKKLTDRVN